MSELPPVVSFVAKSGTGKTTLLEALIPQLKTRGVRVGLLKHHRHPSSFDTPGKDTHRLAVRRKPEKFSRCKHPDLPRSGRNMRWPNEAIALFAGPEPGGERCQQEQQEQDCQPGWQGLMTAKHALLSQAALS